NFIHKQVTNHGIYFENVEFTLKIDQNQRGLGILPYGNFIIRTVGKYGEFRPCVRTWAVLAILPTTLPEGVSL
ncbi:hypothetical protein D7V96_25855, partial [bacterium D16-59]